MLAFVKTESRLKKPILTYSIGKISIDGNPLYSFKTYETPRGEGH